MQPHESAMGIHMSGLPWWFRIKDSTYNSGATGEAGLIPGLGRSPGGRIAINSGILAWRNPQTEDPGGLQSKGPHRVGHD